MNKRWTRRGTPWLAAASGLLIVGRMGLHRVREANLNGQVVLITGGSRGLGLLLAREFAQQGCRLAICSRSESELDLARRDLMSRGADVLALTCDVGDRAQVDQLVQDTTDHFGRIDVLVTNAGIIQTGPISAMTVDDFEQALRINFWGSLYPVLAVLPQMRQRRSGRIVAITSIGGKISVPHLLPYAAAKFAAVGFSEGLRAELARDGVIVTTIVPGLMRTGSPLNAEFKGHQDQEFSWFAVSDSLPFLSMDAERAAHQIVQATRRGQAERTLSAPATLLVRFHGLFPGITANILSIANHFLPPPDQGRGDSARGQEARHHIDSPILELLISWTRSAARRFNEYAGPAGSAK